MPPYNAEPLLDMGIWMVRNGEYDIFLLFGGRNYFIYPSTLYLNTNFLGGGLNFLGTLAKGHVIGGGGGGQQGSYG